MSTRLDETIANMGADNLISDVYPPADVFSVKIRKGDEATTYKRGTVLALSTGTGGDGAFVILGTTAKESETLTANAILAEDVTVGTETDAEAIAYRAGHFNGNTLTVGYEYEMTAADKEALRTVGILLSDAVGI